jgi:hypothetical protein
MSFISTITAQDLALLRGIVRKTHFAHVEHKHGPNLITDVECDKLIENIGPEVVTKMIRFGVDKGLR